MDEAVLQIDGCASKNACLPGLLPKRSRNDLIDDSVHGRLSETRRLLTAVCRKETGLSTAGKGSEMKRLFWILLLLALPAYTYAQDTNPSRFQLERTESGFIRLDRETGAVSLCREAEGNLVCRMAADERAAYEKELDLLGERVTALEKRLDAQPSQNALPGEAEIEQSLSIMERFMRRFMEIIEEFTTERDNTEPAPQRT